jgi:hypothetical protein
MIQCHGAGAEGGIENFSVKNPDSQDIKNGAEFFSTDAPWSSLGWLYQQRLGTEKFT